MPNFSDYSLDFSSQLTSDFIDDQVPMFIRNQDPMFIEFVKAYYRFLESNLIEFFISSDIPLFGDLEVGESISTVHCLMCEDGVTYLGAGTNE